MLTSAQCFATYGKPELERHMVLWDIPADLETGVIPKKLYCNKDLIAPLSIALHNVISRGLVYQIKTFDGCFNIRVKRGGTSYSLHSWGVAIDLNSSHNSLGKSYRQLLREGKKPFTDSFLQCFRDASFDAGGDWLNTPDRMHFQLAAVAQHVWF